PSSPLTVHACHGTTVCTEVSATSGLYPLSLHDALPICSRIVIFSASYISGRPRGKSLCTSCLVKPLHKSIQKILERHVFTPYLRSEEHTSELQSRENLVCRLLLEKKKTTYHNKQTYTN